MTYSLMPDGQSVRRDGDGTIFTPDLSSDLPVQRDYQAWLAAGNAPAPMPPVPQRTPTVTGRQIKDEISAGGYSVGLVAVLSKAGQTGGPKPDDYIYWLGIALDTAVPIDNPKVGRILKAAGVVNGDGSSAVPAFMTAAGALPA